MNLGELLLNRPKDFELILNDGTDRVLIEVHRMVLKANSRFFDEKLNSNYLLAYVWQIPVGSIEHAKSILLFCYLRDANVLIKSPITDSLLANLQMV